MNNYILNDKGEPVVEEDILKWGKWFQNNNRSLSKTEIPDGFVSTVFLGLDHSWGDSPPLLWETMVFIKGNSQDDYTERYSTKEEALAGHERICKQVELDKHQDSGVII